MSDIKFEEAIKKLEKIVEALEKGELSLEDALDKYEEGVKLANLCTKKLEQAERKVNILSHSENGKLVRKPFKEE
ncbi:MAG: exodeoxyribonuclease VII small subunit [Candidatus Omnitrophica bacterium]|nr:exodeoxyribonuclease VII small subunit [Candidatus Omnitrophota bacterium]